MKIFKSILLLLMILVSVFLSSRIWLQIPDFFNHDSVEVVAPVMETVNMWKIVKPIKYYINNGETHDVCNSPEDYSIWEKTVDTLQYALSNFEVSKTDLIVGESYPSNNIIMEFSSGIPIQLFLEKFELDKKDIRTRLNYIERIAIDINDKNSIYICNGDSTVIISNEHIDTSGIIAKADDIKDSNYAHCNLNIQVGNSIIDVKIPEIKTALNPVFVKSEIDINDDSYIEKIARDYFGSDYDYVRKSKEVEGNIVFVYKNEKVLKISSEGLLDFYDATAEASNEDSIYKSLVTALNFTSNFLEFPEDVYLSNVETIEIEGSFGYKFTFNYRILDYPIIFSNVRESQPLEVQVVGNKVISYKRLIRIIDETKQEKMNSIEVHSINDVIMSNLQIDAIENNVDNELKVLNTSDLNNIDNIYLGYFDRGRRPGEQQLLLAWVIKIGDKNYIFNALTDGLFEIVYSKNKEDI